MSAGLAAGRLADAPSALAARRRRARLGTGLLVVVLAAISIVALGAGAVAIPPGRVVAILWEAATGAGADAGDGARDALVVTGIRLPRVAMGILVGAALAVAGALMQGLFRNPLADPGLVGVSSGAGLAAGITIVLGERLVPAALGIDPFALLPVGAFLGGLATTLLLYAIATRGGRTSIATMLLAGIALGALAGAASGVLAFMSDDRQLRDLTFWSLGSLGGATWSKLAIVAPILGATLLATPILARALNALVLGEAEAYHLGIAVERVKTAIVILVAAAVGASVAAAGVIGFVGIVVPHLLRLAIGPDHRVLLPACALLGAALLVLADIVARTLVAPAELPIGIVTAAIGAPFFLWLLLRRRGFFP
ncbi:FecCD family ABC transporter permease [Salinarimonas ramus]|uniref:Hemin ABC transporter permease n=1 Tax=Salinarimonas ramus TaxID=690164 RepID=A0A917Q8L5_9HYPH|nr:iron chelate uptake ABC transporter family permease subunit [Salinarimonas ramus]GGK35233.1 hemin ABC transporter permease [Salinarimonas ramus]